MPRKPRTPKPTTRSGRAASAAATKERGYSEAMAVKILGLLSGSTGKDSQSLRTICAADGMPPEATVRDWVRADKEGFAARYAEARDYALDLMAEDIIRIADGGSSDVQRDRLRADARKWFVSKLAPKRYGDRLQVDADVNLNINSMTDDELNARIAAVMGAKACT